MKNKPSSYSLAAKVFTTLIICLWAKGLQAQFEEVGSVAGYDVDDAHQLKDAVLLSKAGNYYLTNDFKNFIPAPGKDTYLGYFTLADASYFVTRQAHQTNPKYILKLRPDLGLDTVQTFTGPGNEDYEILSTNGRQAFFTLNNELFRFDLNTSEVQQIYAGDLGNQFLKRRRFKSSGTTFYAFDSLIYKLEAADTAFRKGKLQLDSIYNEPRLHIDLRLPAGILFTYTDTQSGGRYSGITTGDTAFHFNKVPVWPDTAYDNYIVDQFDTDGYGWDNFVLNYPDSARINNIIAKRANFFRKDEVCREFQYRWYSFDSLSQSLNLTQDTHLSHYNQYYFKTFRLNGANLAFSMHKNNGYELVKLHPDSVQLLRDVFPGMASGLNQDYNLVEHIIHNGQVYFMGTHPRFGYSLHRSDGTKAGTGLMGSLGGRYVWRRDEKLFAAGPNVYLYSPSFKKGVIFRIAGNSEFLEEKYYQPTHRHWNQSIYSELYPRIFGGGGAQLTRSRMKYHKGLILATAAGTRSRYLHYPEARVSLPCLDRSFYGYTMTYGVFDTSGTLLLPGYIRYTDHTPKLTLGKDTAVHVFLKHENESTTNFDEINQNGRFNFIRTYGMDGALQWSLKLPENFEFADVATDEEGNIYATGIYTGRSLKLPDNNLSSDKKNQYFLVKLNPSGEILYAANIKEDDFWSSHDITTLHFDEKAAALYVLFSEGNFRVTSSCKYHSWEGEVIKINANTGNTVWSQRFETTDLAEYNGITTTSTGEVWVAGQFRGELFIANEEKEIAGGEGNCPTSGLLLCLDGESGAYKKSYSRPDVGYGAVQATGRNIYTVWSSTSRVLESGVEYPRTLNLLVIEKRDIAGKIIAEYKSPTILGWYAEGPLFDFQSLGNEQEDWLLFSCNPDGTPASDSLYMAGVSAASGYGNSLLMRRQGNLFRAVENTSSSTGNSPGGIAVFPNPVSFNEIFVRGHASQTPFTNYQLMSIDGRLVADGQLNSQEWPQYISFPQNLSGLYLLQLLGGNASETVKIFIE